MDTLEYSEKVLRYSEPTSSQTNGCRTMPGPVVPLRPHPKRRDRRLRREEVAASIRMSLRHSHLIGPEDEVFRQFIMDRLEEADQDPYAAPFDCLRSYAFEGTGSTTGSLSSIESFSTFGYEGGGTAERPRDPAPTTPTTRFLRLTPWLGAAEEETSF
ncbi:cadherin-19-like [Engraulis encrasicolus]|uniref:cadherin-19-like n=1 Tax=Engraulis encrasicolus TaxID=184585 RepID=UPI002FD36685